MDKTMNKTWDECKDIVRQSFTGAALYEQLAEEAAELAHAALKVARICRGENPTPTTLFQATDSVMEELSDLSSVCYVIGIQPSMEEMTNKMKRWAERIEEAGRMK